MSRNVSVCNMLKDELHTYAACRSCRVSGANEWDWTCSGLALGWIQIDRRRVLVLVAVYETHCAAVAHAHRWIKIFISSTVNNNRELLLHGDDFCCNKTSEYKTRWKNLTTSRQRCVLGVTNGDYYHKLMSVNTWGSESGSTARYYCAIWSLAIAPSSSHDNPMSISSQSVVDDVCATVNSQDNWVIQSSQCVDSVTWHRSITVVVTSQLLSVLVLLSLVKHAWRWHAIANWDYFTVVSSFKVRVEQHRQNKLRVRRQTADTSMLPKPIQLDHSWRLNWIELYRHTNSKLRSHNCSR